MLRAGRRTCSGMSPTPGEIASCSQGTQVGGGGFSLRWSALSGVKRVGERQEENDGGKQSGNWVERNDFQNARTVWNKRDGSCSRTSALFQGGQEPHNEKEKNTHIPGLAESNGVTIKGDARSS